MDKKAIQGLIDEKLRLLEEIRTNTETQLRFLSKETPKGMQRLLDEREELIQRLVSLDATLGPSGWKKMIEFSALKQQAEEEQAQITALSKQALEKAADEREKAADELRRIRSGKKAQSTYLQSGSPAQGWAVNRKG